MTYHDTTHVSEPDLFDYEAKAVSQDQLVFEFLKRNPIAEVSCEEVNYLVLPDAPITSARRALSNLFKRGLVEKVRKVKGQYGRPIFVWRLGSSTS